MIQFPSYLMLSPYIVGFIFIGLSFFAFRKKNQFKTSLYAFIGAIFIAGVAPALMNHKITLDEGSIIHSSDFIITKSAYGFKLSEIDWVEIPSDEESSKRWILHKKSGETTQLDLGVLWSMYHQEIKEVLIEKGLQFKES